LFGKLSEMQKQERSKVACVDELRHGVLGTYTNHGCRCNECREVMRIYNLAKRKPCIGGCGTLVYQTKTYNQRGYNGLRLGMCRTCRTKKRRTESTVPHGTETKYTSWERCRCDLCREAARLAKAARRAKNPLANP
jgi:hypothetical protein